MMRCACLGAVESLANRQKSSQRDMLNRKAIFGVVAFLCVQVPVFATTAAGQRRRPANAEQSRERQAQSQSNSELAKASEQYRASLQTLAALSDAEVKGLSDKNATIKELLDKGVVSRLEVEQSDRALADARAKADGIHQRLASPLTTPFSDNLAQSPGLAVDPQQWTTGNSRIDALIRQHAASNGVDPYLIYCVMAQESK